MILSLGILRGGEEPRDSRSEKPRGSKELRPRGMRPHQPLPGVTLASAPVPDPSCPAGAQGSLAGQRGCLFAALEKSSVSLSFLWPDCDTRSWCPGELSSKAQPRKQEDAGGKIPVLRRQLPDTPPPPLETFLGAGHKHVYFFFFLFASQDHTLGI